MFGFCVGATCAVIPAILLVRFGRKSSLKLEVKR